MTDAPRRDLFGDAMPSPPAQAFSPAARAFEQQRIRIHRLKQQLEELETLELQFAGRFDQALTPLRRQHRALVRDMVLWLDQRLLARQGKALPALQRETAASILCGLARVLAAQGDTEMAALHDRHSPASLDQQAHHQADHLREMQQEQAQRRARRQAAAERRRAKKAPTPSQLQAEAQQQDAEQTLRSLYRQLASALHPDREPDAETRIRKTALMSEANAAYARRDLVALMALQVRAELVDVDVATRLSEERLAALTQLLKEQTANLERERAARQQTLAHRFALDRPSDVSVSGLERHLQREEHRLRGQLELMSVDLERVHQDAGLRRWLTGQRWFSL